MENKPTPAHPAATAQAVAAPENQSRPRHDGWNRVKMVQFLEALSRTGSVTCAAACVGMSRQSAYALRARLIGQPFDLCWEGALEFALQQVAHEAIDRALNGTIVPVFYQGEEIGEKRVFNERAVLNILLHANRIGRDHPAREHAMHNWTDMIDRVAQGPIIWTEEEHASANPDHPLNLDDSQLDIATYVAECEADEDDRQAEVKKKMEWAENFVSTQSHYAKGKWPDLNGRRSRSDL